MVGSPGFAQTTDSKNPATHWELGVDLLPFFRNKQYSFLIRRASADNSTAFRARIAPVLSYNTSEFPNMPDPIFVNASVDLGIEKRQTYGRIQTYYGADLNFIYYYNFYAVGLSISGPGIGGQQLELDRHMSRGIGGGVSALAGARYFINSHISLGAESYLTASYIASLASDGKVDINNTPIEPYFPPKKENTFSLRMRPLVGFYISYHL